MSSRLEDLRDLARLLEEEKITRDEFDAIKADILEAPDSEWATDPETEADTEAGDETGEDGDLLPVKGLLTWVLAGLGVILGLVYVLSDSDPADGRDLESGPAVLRTSGDEPPDGSLGISLDAIQDRWNALDQPPFIAGGVAVTPEPGDLDGFLYRFDQRALIAGAYDPLDQYVYALLVRVGISHESASNMYVHLCHMLYPGSQGCFDAYLDGSGLFGRPLEELRDVDYLRTWEFDGKEWRLAVEDNVQTIRVLGDRALPNSPG